MTEMCIGAGLPKATCPCGSCAMDRRAQALWLKLDPRDQSSTSPENVRAVLRAQGLDNSITATDLMSKFAVALSEHFTTEQRNQIFRALSVANKD